MKKFYRRAAAMLLSTAVMFTGIGAAAEQIENIQTISAGQELQIQSAEAPETEPQTQAPEAPVTEPETQATEAPVTEPETQITEAPVTEPETQATEAPVTEPETQATEAPVTEPETQTTEAPVTEPETQTTEAPVTEPQTEEETESESESEDGSYTWESGGVTVRVTLPETITLPENAKLRAELKKEDSAEREKAIALVEKSANGLYFGGYLVYDIHFEADGAELNIKNYRSGAESDDIEVTVSFEQPAFQGHDLAKERVMAYHIKELTEAELAQMREIAAAEQENGDVPETEADTHKAVELKAQAELNDGKTAVEKVTFKTDGFSDYVIAVTDSEKRSETEPTETPPTDTPETESETAAAETETESETDTETETSTTEAQTPNLIPMTKDASDGRDRLTVFLSHAGAAPSEATTYHLTVQASDKTYDFKDVKVEKHTGNDKYEEIPTETPSGGRLTIPVTVSGSANTEIRLSGLKAQKYTVDAGGTRFVDNAGQLTLQPVDAQGNTPAYTSLYQVNGANSDGTVNGSKLYDSKPVEITIYDKDATSFINNQNIVISNLYTEAILKVQSGGKPVTGYKDQNGSYELKLSGKSWKLPVQISGGSATVKGLPLGKYSWAMTKAPAGYIMAVEEQAFMLTEPSVQNQAWKAESLMETHPTAVQVTAKDVVGGKDLGSLSFEITGNGETLTCKSGETITGKLAVGEKYTIKQTGRAKGYVITAGKRELTVENMKKTQTVHTENKPTVVSVGVILNKKPHPYLPGAELEIRDANGNTVKQITTRSGLTQITGELDPGKYTLVETKMPNGHYTAAPSAEFTVGSTDKGRTVTKKISNMTTKMIISRKGYDTEPEINGKDVRYYLEGAELEIRDEAGNVVDSFTTKIPKDGESQYVCEGKLNLGQHYTLVETKTPEGYDSGRQGTFSTVIGESLSNNLTVKINDSNGQITPGVTMQTGKARGSIEVAKRASLNGNAIKINRTFYCALFTDRELTQMYSAGGVKPLHMTSSIVYATAKFEGLPAGTYYVSETDAKGNPISGEEGVFTASVSIPQIHLGGGGKAMSEIMNDFRTTPSGGYTNVSRQELLQSYRDEYANYGGSAKTAADLAAGNGNPVSTGDNTNIILYVILVLAAAAACAGVVFYRRKKK